MKKTERTYHLKNILELKHNMKIVIAEDARGNQSGYTFAWQYTAGEARPGQSVTYYGPAETPAAEE